MKLNRIFPLVIFLYLITQSLIAEISGIYINLNDPDTTTFKTTIIYDNYIFTEGTESDWGFSCLIETGNVRILFDTGTQPQILFDNMEKLNISPVTFDKIVISHNHGDHTGGLFAVLEKNKNAEVYLPYSTPENYVKQVEGFGNKLRLKKDKTEIFKDVYLSGEMGVMIKEQCLVLDSDKGLIVVNGCSHPGVVTMLKTIKSDFGKDIYAVFGGFHLMNKSDNEINEIIKEFNELNVLKVGATHCTGEKQIDIFRKAYGDNFIELGVGRILKF